MWCQKCQADVAGIASPDNVRAMCTTCGNEIARSTHVPSAVAGAATLPPDKSAPDTTAADQKVAAASAAASLAAAATPPAPLASAPIAPPPTAVAPLIPTPPAPSPVARARALADPRELLARWAREDALNPLEFGVARDPAAESGKSLKRFDSPHSVAAPRPAAFVDSARTSIPVPAADPVQEPVQTAGQGNIVHQAHAPTPPHFQSPHVSLADKHSKWVTLVGQIFAYVGVGGLTVGTALVVLGYFAGPASYVTTGWLVTTAGQMLLFLGVITLVSGGMEQTTQEVARRIDTLGERLVRIEQAAERAETRK